MPGPLLTALSASPRRAAECLVLEAKDGTRVGFTTWSAPLTIDLGLGAGDEICGGGMVLSSITLAAGHDASFAEVSGPLGPVLTQDAVEGGRWTDAQAWLVRVSPGVTGIAALLAGKAREVRTEDRRWVLEIRNQNDSLNQSLDRTVTAYCDAELGDVRCGYALVPVAATVTAVTDDLRFAVSFAGTIASDFFNLGRATFLTGALAGVTSEKIFDFTGGAGAGSLVLWTPLPEAPQVGDTLELRQGCSKIMQSDDPTVPTCMTFGNGINFRGYPYAPGRDVLLYPNPSSGA